LLTSSGCCFIWGRSYFYALSRRLSRPQRQSGHSGEEMNLLPPPSIKTWTFSQYPSYCIDYAIPVCIKGMSERLYIVSSLLDTFTFCFFHNNVQDMLVLHVGPLPHTHAHMPAHVGPPPPPPPPPPPFLLFFPP